MAFGSKRLKALDASLFCPVFALEKTYTFKIFFIFQSLLSFLVEIFPLRELREN